jgi:hypothetical protein
MNAPKFAPVVEPVKRANPTTEHQRREADRLRAEMIQRLRAEIEKRKSQ